jgi:Cu+-exporting ATPase
VKYLTIDVPISLGIITLFARSAFEIISGTGVGYFDSFAGLVFFLLVGKWFQSRTYSAIAFDRDFKSYFPMAVAKLDDGEESVVLIEKIKKGDRLRILNNQIIPADCILSNGEAIVDYSFVSGESDSIRKNIGDRLYAGGRQIGGVIDVDVAKEVSQSYLTQLWNQAGSTEQKRGVDSDLINRTSQWFSVGIISIALLTLVGWLFIDPAQAMNAFTAVLIIACPCALALAMPFASGNVSRLLGKRGFFLRNAKTLETMAESQAFVFDKTGTLTDNNASKLHYIGSTLSKYEVRMVFSVASSSTHPLSVAISNWLSSELIQIENLKEEPGLGLKARVGQNTVKLGSSEFCGTTDLDNQGSQVHVRINDEFMGTFLIEKGLRDGAQEMVNSIEKSELYMLSGDNNRDEHRMRSLFGEDAQLHFNQSPQSKLEFVQALEKNGKRTVMFGDGLNDAGALKAASTGVAVADNVYSFSPACDVILQADQLRNFGRILRYAKRSIQVVRASIIISLIYNVIGLFFAVQGDLTPIVAAILMPLSSITVVAFVTFITTVIAPDLK